MALKHFSHGVSSSKETSLQWTTNLFNQSSFGTFSFYQFTGRALYVPGVLFKTEAEGSKIRFTFAKPVSSSMYIGGMYIGVGVGSGNPSFQSPPTQVTVGGSPTFLISIDNTVSDEITFFGDKDNYYVVSFCINNGSYQNISGANSWMGGNAPHQFYRKNTGVGCDAGTQTAIGYSSYSVLQYLFRKFEVLA